MITTKNEVFDGGRRVRGINLWQGVGVKLFLQAIFLVLLKFLTLCKPYS